jgi:sulfopyruvate decarboxylase subunit alpha
MMVGLLGKEPDVLPRQSKRYGVCIVEPILDAMGITYHEIERAADVAKIGPAIEDAYARSRPVVLLIGRRPTAS